MEQRSGEPGIRVGEAIESLRGKDVRSATFERLQLTWTADELVKGLSQPLQLGRGLAFVLERISVPLSSHDLIVGRVAERVPDEAERTSILATSQGRWLPDWMKDTGHCCFAWDRLLRLGLNGLEEAAARRAALTDPSPSDDQLHFLRGAELVYGALRCFARRYGRAAIRAGLNEAGASCLAVTDRPPASFREALQLMWLVGLVYCAVLTPNPAISFGRMDELLGGFYRGDLERGVLTREGAGALIEDFYCKMNLLTGRGEHQMGMQVGSGSDTDTGWLWNLCYDSPLYLVLGGRRRDPSAVSEDLTSLFLERLEPRFENPVVVYRYTPDISGIRMKLIAGKIRENSGIHLFNDDVIIPALVRAGIPENEAVGYTMHGCNEPDIPGVQKMVGWSFDRSFWLPRYVLTALERCSDELTMIELYDRFEELVSEDIGKACEGFRNEREAWNRSGPGILRVDDCFFDGPVSAARSWELGGIRYRNLFFSIGSLATAADSVAAIEEVVSNRSAATPRELKEGLETDFLRNERLRLLCLGAPKFGRDDDRADRHAVRLLDIVSDAIDRAARPVAPDGVIVFPCLYTTMGHIAAGSSTGATPDGRLSGRPFSENMSPTPGSSVRGLTAMLRSICKLPLRRITSGILNVRIPPRLFDGEEGLTRFAAILRTYLENGGIQMQVTCTDIEELLDARIHPEDHRDLMVRVTGYNAAFVDMTRSAQEEILRREDLESQ